MAMARQQGVDLVEIAPTATPPVCRIVDFGKFRYEQAKKEKEARKHQHANKVKEIQLSPNIDPHDFGVKLSHAIDFLCDDMKVKVSLRFRGREMAHTEFGFQVVNKFITEVTPYGHPDADPKLIGKGITLMLSPLPRAKRAKNPRTNAAGELPPNQHPHVEHEESDDEDDDVGGESSKGSGGPVKSAQSSKRIPTNAAEAPVAGFANNPFQKLDLPANGTGS
jgi:translation initiation factor IF-3